MPTLTLASVGPGATVQDGGRRGWLRYGVTPAGPMDWVALETANVALGNAAEAAAIEIGPGGVALTVDAPLPLAFAGGGFAWSRADVPLPAAARIMLKPGETLRARGGTWGSFAVLAVPGGVEVAPVMGSRATHTRSRLGGLDGRALQAGDRLTVAAAAPQDDVAIEAPWLAHADAPLGVVLGPQDDHFEADAVDAFLAATWTLTPQADRMAYKLDGPKIAAKTHDIVSDGVALGAIQIAGDGKPMVLMADRQPTGGYAKIAHVTRANIGRLAQLRPGESCHFVRVDAEAARMTLLDLRAKIARTGDRLAPLRRVPSAASLMRENLVGGVTDALR
jgi:5-oxoprolinase (ATP-hydrolysing) subunit C